MISSQASSPEIRQLLVDVANHSHDLVILADGKQSIHFVNRTACRRTGYSSKDLVGKKLHLLYLRGMGASYVSKVSKALREKGRWSGEIEFQRSDGTALWLDASIFYSGSPGHKGNEIVVVAHDLSDRRMLVNQSWKSENRLESVFNTMKDALFVTDIRGKVLLCNSAHAQMSGYPETEIIGAEPPYPWIASGEKTRMSQARKILRKEGSLNNFVEVWNRKSGEAVTVSLSSLPFPLKSRHARGHVITARDVTGLADAGELQRTNERFQMLVNEIQRKATVLKVLDEIHHLVLKNAAIDKVFSAIVAGVKKIVAHDLAGFYVFDESLNLLMPRTVLRNTPFSRRLARFPLPLGEGIIGRAAVTGKMALVNNAQMDPRSRYPEGMKPSIEHFIAVPMKRRKTLFGVLVVARNRSPEFMEDEAELIELFANAATVALENERLAARRLNRHHMGPVKGSNERDGVFSDVRRGGVGRRGYSLNANPAGAPGRQTMKNPQPDPPVSRRSERPPWRQ